MLANGGCVEEVAEAEDFHLAKLSVQALYPDGRIVSHARIA
jgi:hypothetical protein